MNTQSRINELRQNGYTVRVNHVRAFDFVAADTNDGLDNMLTRGEFSRAVSDGKLRYVDKNEDGSYLNDYIAENDELVYGKQVSPIGGFTTVAIEKDGETVARGKFAFNKNQFVKRIGLDAAFGRAVKLIK